MVGGRGVGGEGEERGGEAVELRMEYRLVDYGGKTPCY